MPTENKITVIGLTGGIGCGKSTFCDLMAEHGVAHIDTDQIARLVVEPGSDGLQMVVEAFGEGVLNQDKTLNRQALRQLIFADAKDQSGRERLEAILHPLIQQETERQIRQYQENPNYRQPLLLVAIPLLVEGILKRGHPPSYIDEIWVLDCSEETQITRASQRDGATIEQIKTILANQASRQQRRQYADKMIDNDQDLAHLQKQVEQLLIEFNA
ncbi:dephospho-CoA kinase [Thiomicrorhabdus heinhorstiae]|uniref:Dephospho-CoA kinase n=1 Tax=Thiomicrorhabdus heinhorstiae TaxID=2748010 RepID=A0ABS0C0M3_9GAMM|nr:dephospho-CoA kinase [Thiomicrorhabdus heinhorstiae]MBF6058835.1 dephospho-CoA kinase [Thiomicrorhabdus heinhorstiae]